MNYSKIYNSIIERARSRGFVKSTNSGYYERHHVIPVSLGGPDDKTNLVDLTAREHLICHFLLVKMQKPKTLAFYSMVKAANMMCSCNSNLQQRTVNSRMYETIKKHLAESMSSSQKGSKNSQYGKSWWINTETNETIKSVDKPDGDNWLNGRSYKRCVGCNSVMKYGKPIYCSTECKREHGKTGKNPNSWNNSRRK